MLQVEHAVHRRLHARGAARLERADRVVEPDVAAARQRARRAPCRSSRGTRRARDDARCARDQRARRCALPRAVVGVRLAGEQRAARGCAPSSAASRASSRRMQVAALVAGGAPREADHQRVGIEPSRRCARATVVEQLALERRVRVPQRVGIAAGVADRAASCQVGAWTPLVIAMIGAASLDVRPHRARGLAVELRHRVRARATAAARRPSC